jgi:feS assembly ATPase sufC
MFKIDKLNVKIKDTDRKILKDFSLTINEGEIHAIMGPNGVGKSTLSKVIMHHPDYVIDSGTITYNEKILNDLSTDKIARLGIYLLMQDPSIIDGVSNSEALRTALKERGSDSETNLYTFITKMKKELDSLNLPKDVMHRSINKGLSGGERKKNEVLGLKVLTPSFIILDELDSGLDVDSLKVVAKNINDYLKEHQDTSVLIITHYSRVLDLIKPDFVHEMKDGKIIKTGDITLAKQIEETGFTGVNEVESSENHE